MYRIAIFDLDGTILNTLEDLCDSLNHALALSSMPCRSLAQVRSYLGNGIRALVECGVPENTPPELTDAVFAEFASYYPAHCRIKTAPYPGILQLFSKLRESGIKIAVVSNKIDSAVSVLCEKYFGGRIDFCVGDREGFARKPAPDAVLEALKKISSAPERAVYIGDSDVDIKTAENAGMACISVSWGFRSRDFLLLNGASVIADKPSDIYKILSNT